jgi:hypothetical protein
MSDFQTIKITDIQPQYIISKNGDKTDNRLKNLEITNQFMSNKKLSGTNQ